jgi:subtilase family serine protease
MARSATVAAGLCMVLVASSAPPAAATSVDFGPISHKGLEKLGAAPTGDKLSLQLGLIANHSGLRGAVKAASKPSSSTYGKYLTMSSLRSKYGASKSKRKKVVKAFKKQNVSATVDVTHLRVSATLSINKAQKMFGTKWAVYKTKSGARVAYPVDKPKLPDGIKGKIDVFAGARLQLSGGSSRSAALATFGGGSPTRTGTPSPGCTSTSYPGVLASDRGLFPNQLLTAYGIAALGAAGLQGQGARLAIVGEAPAPASDVQAFRSCFGTSGTQLKIHNAGSIKPIVESSLDAMVASMVAPKLDRFDLWVHPVSEGDYDGDVLGFLKMLYAPLKASSNGTPLPHVISVSYGVCESTVSPYTESIELVERQLTASAALGITVVVAAGDSGSSACARGVPASKLTSSDKKPQVDWPASSPWVLAVGGTNLELTAQNTIASTGPWNDTVYPPPYDAAAGGGGGQSTFEDRPFWQPSQSFANPNFRMVPDVAAFADESPGYLIVCSPAVKGCPGSGQTIAYVGGTSAAAPLVAGMVALWSQQAKSQGLPRPGFIPPLLYGIAKNNPTSFTDVTTGTNALFGGSCCPARAGFDLATGWGSPNADVIGGLLGFRG